MGALGLAMQIVIPGIPMGIGKIELADIPAIIGAAFACPIGGMFIGFIYGMGSGVPLAAIPTNTFAFFLISLLSNKLRSVNWQSKKLRWGWAGVPIIRIGLYPFVMAILVTAIYYTTRGPFYLFYIPVLIRTFLYTTPGALISIPIYLVVERSIPWIYTVRKEPINKT